LSAHQEGMFWTVAPPVFFVKCCVYDSYNKLDVLPPFLHATTCNRNSQRQDIIETGSECGLRNADCGMEKR
jgi:hypothetical protein